MQAALKPIDKFTVPGGDTAVSLCHVCRTVCRRAERAALRADAKYGVDSTALVWLNRLSDYFYLLGRTLTAYYDVQGDPVDSLTRIPFRPQHVASSAPGFSVREVSPCTEIGRFVLSSLRIDRSSPKSDCFCQME